MQHLTGDYPAAAASHQQALQLHRDLGHRLGQAQVLNHLGQLAARTSASREARDLHTRALAIACDIGVPLQQARALDGIGRSYLHDGNMGEAATHLRQALAIYQRIGAPSARRLRELLDYHERTSLPAEAQPAIPSGGSPQLHPSYGQEAGGKGLACQ